MHRGLPLSAIMLLNDDCAVSVTCCTCTATVLSDTRTTLKQHTFQGLPLQSA